MKQPLQHIDEDLEYLMGAHPPTRLVECQRLAQRAGVSQVFAKAEWERPLGNFKVLGGLLAGLRALARHCGAGSVAALLERKASPGELPPLLCASDGNHGLAVAAAARRASTGCVIYLPEAVNALRVARIEAQGARVVRVPGTYDDAVDAAESAASRGAGLLVPDTTQAADDPVVRDVMAGYSRISTELAAQFRALDGEPTHVFVQAGVGGLAAAMVQGLASTWPSCRWLVVEPASAACVARALSDGRPVRIGGELHTSAEMLSCGLASGPAVDILRSANVASLLVGEAHLEQSVGVLRELADIDTTPSGATGAAGLLQLSARGGEDAVHGLDEHSRVLLLITEGPLVSHSRP